MKHLGDITRINGAGVEPVEVIIGGSPCQDLSVAGKRAGLNGERSGLFMEQIRIIKEMRANDRANGRADEFVRPRFMVWENVPGAFSSNGGEDFRIVLEETAKVADPDVSIPRPPKGKWTNAGCIMGRGYSIAWRVLDAQYFGVPQRRRRIALVADFGGESAPEILFKPESLSGDIEQGETQREETAGATGTGVDKAISFQERAGCEGGGKGILIQHDRTGALSTLNNQPVCYGISAYDSNSMKSSNPNSGIYEASTSRTLDNNGGNPACNQGGMIVLEGDGSRESHKGDGYKQSDTMYTLNTIEQHAVCYSELSVFENHSQDSRFNGPLEVMQPVTATYGMGDNNQPLVVNKLYHTSKNNHHHTQFTDDDKIDTLVALDYKDPPTITQTHNFVIRRLTPLECERLQGYPDYWTHIGDWTDSKGKLHKDADSPKYKALGNSIAVPCWRFILQGISDRCNERTMASLFDGVGGFPLIWEQINGSKSCRWVSEIEEFPIAVTKIRFEQE